ncbi:MAG TPA: hypothetical protein VKB76_03320 [Ktedonobacterales bacterium]|nr:hypothetical protein [Ktedonobacterales bacterium]
MRNHFHWHGDEPEDLPSDLASLRRRLVADGKVWQRETSAERLSSFARSLPRQKMAEQDRPSSAASER